MDDRGLDKLTATTTSDNNNKRARLSPVDCHNNNNGRNSVEAEVEGPSQPASPQPTDGGMTTTSVGDGAAATTSNSVAGRGSPGADDIEQFQGKIVYNPDGSAYIIEDGDLSDDEVLADLPRQEGSIVEKPGKGHNDEEDEGDNELEEDEDENRNVEGAGDDSGEPQPKAAKKSRASDHKASRNFPTIENAIYVARTKSHFPSYVRAQTMMLERPTVHSYRVHNYRQNGKQQTEDVETVDASDSNSERSRCRLAELIANSTAAAACGPDNVPVKPILMCFICKLSFGNSKSFKNHCHDDHGLDFNEEEMDMLKIENISALIQPVGKDKRPLLSFLEPVAKGLSSLTSGVSSSTSSTTNTDKVPSIAAVSGGETSATGHPVSSISPAKSPSNSEAVSGAAGGIRVRNDLAAFVSASATLQQQQQQISPVSNGRCSTSPGANSLSPSPSPFQAANIASAATSSPYPPLKGTTIGACPDHVQGRPTGVDCAKCDLILSASMNRLSGNGSGGSSSIGGWNASNNACKTLKCPKCNWHYKYQETLEIHMKEKHPDSETTCIYCITSQQHPRLARGETYTCGYKPYRCEICNYSTTTKGNLSIHMQSDKHINNMQELQNNGATGSLSNPITDSASIPSPSPSQSSKYATPSTTPKPQDMLDKDKPCFKCEVCSYETNIARNLKIHMTSEKHLNNVMNQQLQGGDIPNSGLPGLGGFPPGAPGSAPPPPSLQQLLGMTMLPGGPGGSLNHSPMKEANMADMAFSQALQMMQMQMMAGGPPASGVGGPPLLPPGMPPLPLSFPLPAGPNGGHGGPGGMMGHDNEHNSDMDQAPDPNPRYLFNCAVCREFSCDHLQALSDHLAVDRTKLRETEVSILIGGTYICKLCSYKTNLKANFQLHCKTDKHLQKLQLVNHIMEGGPANEWKLNYLNVSNSVQLRCNACDFYTDSIHKLQIHSSNQGHEVSTAIFLYLRKEEATMRSVKQVDSAPVRFTCQLCSFSTSGKALLLQHCRSVNHLKMEQFNMLQRRSEGKTNHPDIGDIFAVALPEEDHSKGEKEMKEAADDREMNDEGHDQMEVDNHHDRQGQQDKSRSDSQEKKNDEEEDPVTCPLCQEGFNGKESLEEHAMSIHSINSEGLERLMLLMQGSHWLNRTSKSNKDEEGSNEECRESSEAARTDGDSTERSNQVQDKYSDPGRPYKCDICRESFTQKSILLVHYNSVGHLRNVKKKMQEGGGESLDASNNEASDLDKSGISEASVSNNNNNNHAASPKKEDKSEAGPGLGENFLQAMLASRLQMLNPMLRPQMPPGLNLNPMAMMAAAGLPGVFGGATPPTPGGGMPLQLQQLQQLALAQQMAGGAGGAPRLPDPTLLMSQLAQLTAAGGISDLGNKSGGPSELSGKLPFPPMSPVHNSQLGNGPAPPVPTSIAPESPMFGEQKRARTKITEEQLKILRSNFDISNSPSDEQIHVMAQQTGLPPKVIKHWFRNTLFKERQKNKDSPYNFNNPPSTMINLEEYEKTGDPKVMPISATETRVADKSHHGDNSGEQGRRRDGDRESPDTSSSNNINNNNNESLSISGQERSSSRQDDEEGDERACPSVSSVASSHHNSISSSVNFSNATNPVPNNVTQSSLPSSLTLSSILSSQSMADSMACHLSNYPPPLGNNPAAVNPFGQSPEHNSFSKILHNLAANNSYSEPSSPQSSSGNGNHHHQRLSPGQNDLSMPGKRANRTRFSDYQVKVLQEFFEKNAYPKDDDLEYLSRLLNLTPRVIVVWFQNARQKARKAYENQPSGDVGPGASSANMGSNMVADNEAEGRFTRTPSLSYQCKKCNLEFQRYYELIRHQKQHCYKEEDAKRSALAQKAAAQAAASLGSGLNLSTIPNHSEDSNSSINERNITSPIFNQNSLPWKRKSSVEESEMDMGLARGSKLPKTTNLFPPLIPPAAPPTLANNDLEASMRKFYEDTMKRYVEELQTGKAPQGIPPPPSTTIASSAGAGGGSGSVGGGSAEALDLRSSSADLDHGSHRSDADNDSDSWDKNLSGGEDSSSENNGARGSYGGSGGGAGSDFDGELCEGGVGMMGGSGSHGGKDSNNSKRFRTHMSNVQVKMMKSVFENYKTPTMPECLSLGNQIGLQKRVVQVWFQNARAKEKKARLYLQQVTSQEPDMPGPPRGCRWCSITYPENFAVQEHIFQPKHLENVRQAVEQGLYDPESPGAALTQQAEALQNGGGNPVGINLSSSSVNRSSGHLTPPRQHNSSGMDSNTDSSPSPTKPNLGPGLAMMAQMAAAGGPGAGSVPGGAGNGGAGAGNGAGPLHGMSDAARSMLGGMPFYGIGQGISGYPIGVTNSVHNV